MSQDILRLQMQYANAVYQQQRWAREAELTKALLDRAANSEALAAVSRQFGSRAKRKGGEAK